jgi:hypothetical protein
MQTKELGLTTVGAALDNLGNSYQLFLTADNKKDKVKYLWSIRLAAIDVHKGTQAMLEYMTGKLMGADPRINPNLTERVNKTSVNIHMQVLNLDQLFRHFIMPAPENDTRTMEQQVAQKVQFLYQIHNLSADIAEAALVTSAEPDKNTDRA